MTTHAPAAVPPPRKRPWLPWALIGCGVALVVIFGLAIIAAIALPNFAQAVNKAKQKRTMADMHTLGTALMAYATDHPSPAGDPTFPEAASIDELVVYLEPDYLRQPPTRDGWENPYRYACRGEVGAAGCTSFRIVAAGRDGVFELADPWAYGPDVFPVRAFDRDIVFADGYFLQYPGRPED